MSQDFWNFSCVIYDEAQDILLRLQDEAGCDINVLLFCGWLGKDKYRIVHMGQVMAIAKFWNDYIVPLRDLRRKIKSHDDNLYQATKALELQYEKSCQQALQHYAETAQFTIAAQGDTISDNLYAYVQTLEKGEIASWIDESLRAIGDMAKDYKET